MLILTQTIAFAKFPKRLPIFVRRWWNSLVVSSRPVRASTRLNCNWYCIIHFAKRRKESLLQKIQLFRFANVYTFSDVCNHKISEKESYKEVTFIFLLESLHYTSTLLKSTKHLYKTILQRARQPSKWSALHPFQKQRKSLNDLLRSLHLLRECALLLGMVNVC